MSLRKNIEEISLYRSELMTFAALGIFVMHVICEKMFSLGSALDRLLVMYGSTGVDVFLFVSGMGCFCSLKKDSSHPVAWIKRRILKVYIPYLMITLCFLTILPVHSLEVLLLKISGLYFWFLGNDGTWFVSFIILMYLISPLLYNLLNRKTESASCLTFGGILLLSILLIGVFAKIFPAYYALVGIGVTRIPSFITGMWLGYLVVYNKQFKLKYILLFGILAVIEFLANFPDSSFMSLLFKSCRSFVIMYLELWLFSWGAKHFTKCIKIIKKKCISKITLEFYLIHLLAISVFRAYPVKWNDWYTLPFFAVSLLLSFIVKSIAEVIYKKAINDRF